MMFNGKPLSLTQTDFKKLEASWIPRDMAERAGVFRVNSEEGAQLIGRHDRANYAGIVFPYYWPGEVSPREYCLRRDCPDLEQRSDGSVREKAKYLVPPGRQNLLYFAPGTRPEHLREVALPIIITEGPKKTLALARLASHESEPLRFLAMGLSGVYNWRGRVGRMTGPDGGRQDVKGPIGDLDRLQWRDRVVMIAFDSDAASNPDVQRARQELAMDLEGRGACVYFIDIPHIGGQTKTGIDDLLAAQGPDAALNLLDRKARARDAGEITRLARLSPIEYARERKAAARRLEVPVSALDREIALHRRQPADTPSGKGRPFELPDIVPAMDAVDGQQMFADLIQRIRRYVVVTDAGVLAIALWVIRAHAHDLFEVNPRLTLLSPEKRCGKTTLLEILHHLTPRALLASNITPASIFRVIESAHPTLLLDEMDSFTEAHEELRGILNSGHTRDSARVVRTVGDEHEPRQFSTWCPMVLAAIGRLPETLEDRSVIIPMKRRTSHEPVDSLRRSGRKSADARADLSDLASRIARWVEDATDQLRTSEPEVPAALGDRAKDNWSPLLAIAEAIGDRTARQARDASLELSGKPTHDTESKGTQLLADIKGLLGSRVKIGSRDLCEELTALEESPWGEWNRGKPLSQNQLAKLLRPYGVRSKAMKVPPSEKACQGYEGEAFKEAFNRYLPSPCEGNASQEPLSLRAKCNGTTSRASIDDSSVFRSATEEAGCTSQNGPIPAPDAASCTVALPNPEIGLEEDIFEEDHAARSR